MPIQFLAGKKDALLPSETSLRRLKKLLPHAETHLYPDCGHAVIGKADEILEFQLRRGRTDPIRVYDGYTVSRHA
jgi:pimeloyl-ACP methyl ester carboxylesterase